MNDDEIVTEIEVIIEEEIDDFVTILHGWLASMRVSTMAQVPTGRVAECMDELHSVILACIEKLDDSEEVFNMDLRSVE